MKVFFGKISEHRNLELSNKLLVKAGFKDTCYSMPAIRSVGLQTYTQESSIEFCSELTSSYSTKLHQIKFTVSEPV
jgi:hypothetical protein